MATAVLLNDRYQVNDLDISVEASGDVAMIEVSANSAAGKALLEAPEKPGTVALAALVDGRYEQFNFEQFEVRDTRMVNGRFVRHAFHFDRYVHSALRARAARENLAEES